MFSYVLFHKYQPKKNQDVFNPTTVVKKGRPAGLHPVNASQNNLHELARSKFNMAAAWTLKTDGWKTTFVYFLLGIWVYFQGRCHVKLSGGYLK